MPFAAAKNSRQVKPAATRHRIDEHGIFKKLTGIDR